MNRFLTLLAALCLLHAAAWAEFDGTGNFNRIYNWEVDKANNVKVRADRMDTEMDGFATGLSTCVTKDGQTTVTADLPMSGFNHTGVGDATASNEYASAGQVRDNKLCTGNSGGSANAYTLTRSIVGSGYVTGTVAYVTIPATNTASSSLNLDSLGAKEILNGTSSLVGGELVSGSVFPFYYDGSHWQMMGSAPPVLNWYSLTNIPTQVSAVSNSGNVSLTNLSVSGSVVGGLSTTAVVSTAGLFSSADITATNRTLTARLVTVSTVNTTSMTTANLVVSGTLIDPALLPIQIAVFNGNSSCTKIGTGYNFASCTRISAGRYGISPTNNFTDGNYAVTCSAQQRSGTDAFPQTGTINSTPSATTTGYVVATGTEAAGNGDNARISCIVYKN